MKRDPLGRLTRRGMLATGGAALGTMALPVRGKAQPAPPVSRIMAALSAYMASAAEKPLPESVVEKSKQMILDTLGAMVSGAQLPPGKFAHTFARAFAGDKVCTVVASDIVTGPIEAALANGLLAHSDETDDTHPPSQSHPAASIVPAALAAGEKFGADGNRFIRAVALGYDIGPRVTETLGKLQYMVATHRSTHSLSGTFGSAAAAGCMAGLSQQQMRWLLSYTAQQASGLASWQRDTDHIEKAFDFGGMPARNGVTAALLVKAGGTAVDDILSGTDNFLDAFMPMNNADLLIDGLGDRYEILRTNVKKWTVGAPIQAALDAMVNLFARERFSRDQVTKVVVRVATDEAKIVDNRVIPDISMQHLMAVMLIDKTVTFESAHDAARMKDPEVLKERAKVELVGEEELERLMPKRVAVVEVTLKDGRILRERVEAVRGTAENPMTRQEMIAKARDLMVPVLGAAKFQKLSDTIFALETVNNLTELRPLLQV